MQAADAVAGNVQLLQSWQRALQDSHLHVCATEQERPTQVNTSQHVHARIAHVDKVDSHTCFPETATAARLL
jgi:hypothetical protein